MDKEKFVRRLKEARENKKLTLKELADQCGVSLSAVNRYAAQTSIPPLEVAAAMAQVLEVSLDWLCGIEKENTMKDEPTVGNLLRTLSSLLTMPVYESPSGYLCAARFETYVWGETSIKIMMDDIPKALDFDSWKKFLELYMNGTIDESMYCAWIDKMAAERDSVILPVQACDTDSIFGDKPIFQRRP